jgi:hypothetical protein
MDVDQDQDGDGDWMRMSIHHDDDRGPSSSKLCDDVTLLKPASVCLFCSELKNLTFGTWAKLCGCL